MTKNNYSLYNSYDAEFGIGKYFANKAAKDMKSVIDSGATQEVIDDVVKRAINSGEKEVTQKAQRLGKKARRLWKASPKLRRNVKIAGVAGAGLVGLNALTGLKTVYDIGKGIKNKIMSKKQQNAQYSLFNPYAVEFARNQQQPKEKSELQRWGGVARNSALAGGAFETLMLANPRYVEYLKTKKIPKSAAILGGAATIGAAGTLGYGAYRGGKALVNKIRGKRKQEANYNALNASLANFKETQEQPKKKSLVKKGLKYAAIGGVGLAGLGAAGRYGGAAVNYRLAKRNLENIETLTKTVIGKKGKFLRKLADTKAVIDRAGAKGQLTRDLNRLKGKTNPQKNPFDYLNID